eukprot:SAG31_NODE_1124_length_9772_cov_11.331541_11_plen_46_part_00
MSLPALGPQDDFNRAPVGEVAEALSLGAFTNHKWTIQGVSAVSGE